MFALSQITWYGKNLIPAQMQLIVCYCQVIPNFAMAAPLQAACFISFQFILILYAAVY